MAGISLQNGSYRNVVSSSIDINGPAMPRLPFTPYYIDPLSLHQTLPAIKRKAASCKVARYRSFIFKITLLIQEG